MRLKSLDIARGIGIILVVMGHFLPEGVPYWYSAGRQVIYSFHMPLFLFISGFVYMYTHRDDISYGAFLKKKFRRIVVPYLAVSFLFIGIKFIPQMLGIYVRNPVTADSFLRVFYYPEAAVSLWYLWALWWFYMIVPLLKSPAMRIIALVAAMVIAWIPFDLPDVCALPKVKEMFRYFMLGVVAAEWRDLTGPLKRIPSYAVYAFNLLLLFLWLRFGIRSDVLLALAGIASVLKLSGSLVPLIERGKLGWLDCVSSHSYTIYLLHPIFVAAVLAVFKSTGLQAADPFELTAALAAAVAAGVIGPIVTGVISGKVFSRLRGDSDARE